MAIIEKFLGRRVAIPEDRHYFPRQGLWAKRGEREIVFGLTEPFLVMAGGFNELDWIVPDGQKVNAGEAIIFAITGKILYIDSPVDGTVFFNSDLKNDPTKVVGDPYGTGWLFKAKPEAGLDSAVSNASDHRQYMISLKGSEGFKNPEGLKGGVSGICKAVYSSIKEQKFERR